MVPSPTRPLVVIAVTQSLTCPTYAKSVIRSRRWPTSNTNSTTTSRSVERLFFHDLITPRVLLPHPLMSGRPVSGRTITRNQSPSEAIQATRIGHLPTARIAVTYRKLPHRLPLAPTMCPDMCVTSMTKKRHAHSATSLVVRYSFRLARLITTMPTAMVITITFGNRVSS